MSIDQILSFSLFAFVASVTPGPNNVMLTALGANFGFMRGLPCVFGIACGFGLMLGLVIFGLGSIILSDPDILEAMRWAGAAFLFWLAWKVATAGRVESGKAPRPVGFLGAAAFQWVNAKAWLIATSATATYLEAGSDGALSQSLAMSGLFVLAAVPCCLLWLGFGAMLQRALNTPRRLQLFNGAMALTLAGSVVLFIA